jgi:hypothetical protein
VEHARTYPQPTPVLLVKKETLQDNVILHLAPVQLVNLDFLQDFAETYPQLPLVLLAKKERL